MARNKRSFVSPAVRIGLLGLFVYALIYSAQVTRDASLTVRVLDAQTGEPTPVRVSLVDAQGNRPEVTGAATVSESAIPVPKGVVPVMYGRSDAAEGYLIQPDGAFYVDGAFEAKLPAGTYTVTLSKGNEYLEQVHTLELTAGEHASREYRLQRWINMPERGWYSADDHIHLQRSPRDDPSILRWMAAEDIHVGNILQMGDFWADYYTQYSFGEKGRYQEDDYLLSPGQEEPRTPEIGHTISLGADAYVRFRNDYYSYDRLFDRVHELGGITGFAHQGVLFHAYRGMTLNVLRNKVDFVELVQFCAAGGPLVVDHYYHFLDLGFKLTALAGSDFPWCGNGPRFGIDKPRCSQIGNARFYAYAGEDFSFDAWMRAVKAGRTFATSGPVVTLKVNDRLPGDALEVTRGTKLRVTAKAYGHSSQVPLRALEIVGHGEVLKKVTAAGAGQSSEELSVDLELEAEHGIWIAARCEAGPAQAAHTTPVYITVDGGGFHNPNKARHYLDLSEAYLRELEEELGTPGAGGNRQAVRHKARLQAQIAETRVELEKLAARLGI